MVKSKFSVPLIYEEKWVGGSTYMSETERMKDLIQKNESRGVELIKTIEAVIGSFSEEIKKSVEELDKVNATLEEVEKRITEHEDNIMKLEEKKEGLRSETGSLEQQNREADKKISALNSELVSSSKELMKNQDILKRYLARNETESKELDNTQKAMTALQQEMDTTREANEREFQERRTGYEDAQRKIKELVEKEPLANFLLTEGSQEPPEIAIVAKLIKENGLALIDDLKKVTKVPPALALKTINSLEQKGILEKTDSNQVKLLKTP
jgi:chromosome segregation ATPase